MRLLHEPRRLVMLYRRCESAGRDTKPCFTRGVAFAIQVFIALAATAPAAEAAQTLYARASAAWNVGTTWSTVSSAGASCACTPQAGDTVIIGNTAVRAVTIPAGFTTANVASIAIGAAATNGPSSLTLSAANSGLTVSGAVTIASPAANNTNALAINAGSATIGSIDITGGAGNRIAQLAISTGTATVTGGISFAIPAVNARVTFSNTGTLKIGTTFGNDGTFTASTGTIEYNGTVAQTVNNTYSYNNLTINKGGGSTATLGGNTTVGGNLTVTAGTLALSTFTANRTAAGGTISVANGATLSIGGTNPFPTNYSAFALGATSTVNYSGTTQNVASAVGASGYGHLILSGTLTKTALGTFTVRGDLSITGVTFDSVATVQTVNGNVSNTGTHTATTGSITLSGGAAAHALSGAGGTYANLILNDANGATLGANTTVSGTLTLTSGTFAVGANTLTLSGPTIAGTPANFSTTSSSSLTFAGSTSGVNVLSSVTQLNNLTISNANGVTLSSSPTVNGTLTFTSGNLNTTTANTLTMAAAALAIVGAAASRHVVGNLAKAFSAATVFTYAVGDGINYTPLAVTFSAAVTGNLTASVTNTDHPNTTGVTSGIDAAKSINRYWTLKNSTISGTYSAALNYIDGTPVDRDSGATASSFIIQRGATCSGGGGGRTCASWGPLTLSGVPSNTLATATGVSIASDDPAEADFAIGEPAPTRFSREKEFIYTRERY